MSSFNNLLGRLSFITEAKGEKSGRSLKTGLPSYLQDPYGKVYKAAQEKGTTAPREARIYIVDIIASLISKKLGRELTTNEFEKGLKKLYNVSNGDMFLKYLETNKPEDTEETYSELLSGLSSSDVEQAEGEQKISKEEKLQQQISMRPASKDYDAKAVARELKKREQEVAREKKKDIKKLEKAAQKSGNDDLADTFNVIDDIVTKTAQQIGVDVETQVDPETMGYARFAKGVQQSKDIGLDQDTLDITLTGRLASPENIAKIIKAFSRVKGVTADKMGGKPGVTIDLPVGMIKSAEDANTQVERLFGNLFPGEDIENIDVQFYTDSEDEEGDGDVEAEYYPGVTDEDKEEASKPWPDEDEETIVKESYTSQYLTEQVSKDRYINNNQQNSVSFKERMKPKTIWQLEEMRRYGL